MLIMKAMISDLTTTEMLTDSSINTHSLLILADVKCWMFQVSLPDRTCEVHQLKLSQDEQAVYDVVFAQSR